MGRPARPEIVVITGASAGVGRATVREFARHGAHIGLLARGRDGLEGARRDVEAADGKALVLPTDVADPAQVEAAAVAVEEEFGPIDIWVNNAMTSVFSPFKEMTLGEFRRVTEVTYLGVVWGTMVALKRMLPRDHGSIVQVGSALAYRAIPLQSAYCGAKHAIQGFTESIRAELIHDHSKVYVSMVQLPGVNTPQFRWVLNKLPKKAKPVGPIFKPEVAARAIYWAAHHRRRELNVGGPTDIVLLGNKIAPGFGEWDLGRTAFEGQQTDEPQDPDALYNLWEPVPGDHGADGVFTSQAKSFSPQLWLSMHRRWVIIAGAGMITAYAALRGK